MMHAEPQQEHRWLQKLVGEWAYESEVIMEPGKPPEKSTGTESVRSLGDVWVLCEGQGKMPDGSPATTLMTLGYDPAKKRFVGTFIGSMMTFLWEYDGELDASGKVLTLNSQGPGFSGDGKMVDYKDVIEFKSDDERTLTSSAPGADGKWNQFMKITYRRKK